MTSQERIGNIIQSGIQYNDLSSNLKVTVRPGEDKKEKSVDAQLRIVKNEAIQISFRIPIIGSEAFRILITPNNLLIIDRLNRQYLYEPMQNIQMQIPFDFDYYSMEALLTNQLFIAGKKEIGFADYTGFQLKEDKFNAHISYTDRQGILYNFESNYTNRIQALRMKPQNGSSSLQGNYIHWGLASNSQTFPMTLNLQLQTSEKNYDLNLSHQSVAINTAFTIDYTIPNNYRKVTLQQVFRLIEQLS